MLMASEKYKIITLIQISFLGTARGLFLVLIQGQVYNITPSRDEKRRCVCGENGELTEGRDQRKYFNIPKRK